MEWLLEFDKKLLLLINGWGTPSMDPLMEFFSAIPVCIPLYVIIAGLCFVPSWYGRRSFIGSRTSIDIPVWIIGLVSVLAVALCFGLTDQISLHVKNSVGRLRPCFEPALDSLIRFDLPNKAAYGFFSGHACNTFGLATITALIFKRRIYSAFIFIWAAIVSFSRIYLAKHYPLDILCGLLAGIVIAVGVYYLWKFSIGKTNACYHKKRCSAL